MALTKIGSVLFSTGPRRRLQGLIGHVVTAYCAALALWTLYSATYSRIDALALTIIFLCLMLVPSFLLIGATSRAASKTPSWLDYVLAASALACSIYFILNIDDIATRISLMYPLDSIQFGFALLITILTLEITRRSVGLLLCLIVLIFIAYNLFGDRLEGTLRHGEITLNHFLDINVYTSDGLFGVPVRVAATYAFLFVMFGTFLERAGGADFFFNLAASVSGRSPGGPAKVAAISSAMFGTMSGSPTADVVTTGSITIPMMKRLGYSPSLAGGVEVAASTGGSLIPPVMGSAAFIMAEITGIDYFDIAVAAILPAILYYVGVYVQIHFRSIRLNLQPLPADQIQPLRTTMRSGWIFIVPLGVLVAALGAGYSPTMVAAFGIVAVIVVSQLRSSGRLTVRAIYESLAETTVRMIGVTGACAAAGLVIGGITMTGLAAKFSFIAFAVAGDSLIFVLLLSALVTIILGLGMPTPSAYILAAVLIGPTLVDQFEVPLLNAHMFLMYFAVMSAMTPPVAVAAYAAAAIAGANPLAVAVTAVRFSIVAFIVPFGFALTPIALTPGASLIGWCYTIGMLLGAGLLAVACEGWLYGVMPIWRRLALTAAGLALLSPSLMAGAVGLIAAIWIVVIQKQSAARPVPT